MVLMRHHLPVWIVALALVLGACGGGGGSSEPEILYTAGGTVTGSVIENVVVRLGGDLEGMVATDSRGLFLFQDLPPGTYSVTPEGENLFFAPGNRIFPVESANVSGLDFVSSGTGPNLEDVSPPASTQRLVFVYYSGGGGWLDSSDGALAARLATNNYCVFDVTAGWDAPLNTGAGSRTDIGHWYTWFLDPTGQTNGSTVSENITGALYTSSSRYASYTPLPDPGGESTIVLLESSFLNSAVKSDDGTPAVALRGNAASSSAHTLPNCKAIYRDILAYFKLHTDKMFVIATAPPLTSSATLLTEVANAQELNRWLLDDWLAEGLWERRNVYVFDLFSVLADVDNHHRVVSGVIQHIRSSGDGFAYYPSSGTDSTPTSLGNQKATDELVPLLNSYWHRYQSYVNP